MSGEESDLLEFPTEDELLVAGILLDLPWMIKAFESPPGFRWVGKKRRSCLDNPPPREESSATIAAVDSPVTPLSYNPSESNDHVMTPRRNDSSKRCPKKTSEQEYVGMMKELIQCRDVLRGELEKVTEHYVKLEAYNSLLKDVKQEVLTLGSMNLGMESTQQRLVDQPQPSVSDRTAEDKGPIEAQSSNGSGPDNNGGPIGIPDLNLSLDEKAFELGSEPSQPSDRGGVDEDDDGDEKRARCAEARRRRKGLIKIKSVRSACGIRLPDPSS